MAKTLGRFSTYSAEDIDFLVKSLQLLILGTIQTEFRIPMNNGHIAAPSPYDNFADHIYDALEDRSHPQKIAIITFNYDMALDLAFYLRGIQIRYGLQTNEKITALPLLKLHGSLNWVQCASCNEVVPWHLHDYFQKYNWN